MRSETFDCARALAKVLTAADAHEAALIRAIQREPRGFSSDIGISATYVCAIRKKRRSISRAVLKRIIKAGKRKFKPDRYNSAKAILNPLRGIFNTR